MANKNSTILAIISGLTLGACQLTGIEGPRGNASFSDKDGQLSFTHPANWQIRVNSLNQPGQALKYRLRMVPADERMSRQRSAYWRHISCDMYARKEGYGFKTHPIIPDYFAYHFATSTDGKAKATDPDFQQMAKHADLIGEYPIRLEVLTKVDGTLTTTTRINHKYSSSSAWSTNKKVKLDMVKSLSYIKSTEGFVNIECRYHPSMQKYILQMENEVSKSLSLTLRE